jgi:hypothetical protein
MAGLLTLPSLGPGHHHVDIAAAAPGADEPLAPLEARGLDGMPPRNQDKDQLDLLPSGRTISLKPSLLQMLSG